MPHHTRHYRLRIQLNCLFLCLLCAVPAARAQQDRVPGTPVTLQNAPQRDTSSRTNTSSWVDEQASIYFRKAYSDRRFFPDSAIHTFHRRPFSQPWYINTGNLGSPARNGLFTPEDRTGPTLGYHTFDVYRFNIDSLNYYNTTRPYSVFTYNLGSKAEQVGRILHTQNIKPNWNFAACYQKINAPGYYKVQRTNHDNAFFTTNYQSRDQHYQLFGALVYNKEQNDENGGIVADSFLTDPDFSDRRTVPVSFQNDGYSVKRSAVTNKQRDFSILLYHHYTVGKMDTLYNADSSQYYLKLKSRFRITHRFQMQTEKHEYKDVDADSLRYTGFFEHGFENGDSVYTVQKWFFIDNALLLSGYLGAADNPLLFSAGVGIRTDQFTTDYASGENKNSYLSNYLVAEIGKTAVKEKQWDYGAKAKLFTTGEASGNFAVHAFIGRDISNTLGSVNIGFKQELNNAPYSYTIYQNQYSQQLKSYNKESITQLYGTINNDRLHMYAGVRNYLISNYIYINPQQQFDQYSSAFNLTQVWLRKTFYFRYFVLDNELAWQQKTGSAPINVPALMGRHQLSLEKYVFKNALKLATGIDIRYHTGYEPAGYSPFLNRFYYQNSYSVTNTPEISLFFNFKVKNFRAFLMGDQLQQLFARNAIYAPGYAAQNAMLRFGFTWVLIN